ncbi:hypothetical protein C8F04DRAFT_1213232 [Mycena alexandri]|uniref:RNase H type-1 domain-containing protein n=1 Tax=Mycena alexandri TaxID=1745969 RepID=A0AAD6SBS1_9AGAR|nr:hypothetical protein C8F04DRAFT_1213232 [Mycena alexandri]
MALTRNKKKWENQGYIGLAKKDLNRATLATMRQKKRTTKLKWVKGHSGHETNEGADRKVDEGAKKPTHDEIPLDIPPELTVTGAKLSSMTQSLAERTKLNIEKIKAEVEDACGFRPTEPKIWKFMRSKDLSRQIRNFLWTTTHGRYVVGTHWLRDSNSQEEKERANCQHCGKVDSMEHILSEIWRLAKELWTKRNPDWPWTGLGMILGSCLATFKDTNDKIIPGDARLYRILLTESAYLIWKLRGERIMQKGGAHPTLLEIHNRWIKAMNARLKMDCDMTHPKYEKTTVLKTWKGVLKDEDQLPDDWTAASGVLVDIQPMRQQEGGREREVWG